MSIEVECSQVRADWFKRLPPGAADHLESQIEWWVGYRWASAIVASTLGASAPGPPCNFQKMRSPSWSKVPKSHSPCGSLSSVKTSNVSTFSLLADRRLRLGRKSAKCLESAQAGMRGPWPWGPGRSARQCVWFSVHWSSWSLSPCCLRVAHATQQRELFMQNPHSDPNLAGQVRCAKWLREKQTYVWMPRAFSSFLQTCYR